MRTGVKKKMGRFAVEFEVANNIDLALASEGHLRPDQVRRMRISGTVDSDATPLVLPASVVKQLGLSKIDRVKTRYADGRESTREVVDEVRVTLLGRERIFDAIVEPNRKTALIGAIVLEMLDFLIDPTKQKLVPRDPKQIVAEIE